MAQKLEESATIDEQHANGNYFYEKNLITPELKNKLTGLPN